MQRSISRLALMVAVLLSSVLMVSGCGSSGDADPGGGGTAGSGGTTGVPIVVPQCVSSGYQMVFRALIEPPDPMLRYMDTPENLRPAGLVVPEIATLTENRGIPGVYSRFTWDANDVQGVSDPVEHTLITVDFVESTGLNPGNLDNGISNMEVIHVPWEMTVSGPTVVGEGKMSVAGLGEDTIRMSIVDFNPWYEGWLNICRFEVGSFTLHLDLATPGSEPTAVVVGFTAVGDGFAIENGWILFGEGDTANFTGEYKLGGLVSIPFDLDLDYGPDPATMTGTYAGLPASCTIDLSTFEVTC